MLRGEERDINTAITDAFIAVSNDNGTSFDTTRLSIPDPNGLTHAIVYFRPVISGDNVYVTWTEYEDMLGT